MTRTGNATRRGRDTATWLRVLLVMASALVALAWSAGEAQAEETKPLVLVMVDTSNSMEYNNGPGAVIPTCYTGASNNNKDWCRDGLPNATHTKSRMTVAIEALTGQFDPVQYKCCEIQRSTQEPDPEVLHYAVPLSVPQIDNGIMDVYREEVRFGLMTFDNHPHPNSGNMGFFSYGGGTGTWNSGALDKNANRGNHGYGFSVERATGAFQVIPPSDDPATITSGNDSLQNEIRWLFPRGTYSPVAPIIDDAHYYIVDDSTLLNDGCYTERPKGVILVTDGQVHFDECFQGVGTADGPSSIDMDGDGLFDDCDDYYHLDGGSGADGTFDYPGQYYRTSEYQAKRLLDDTGFPTYVIGFNASATADAKLRGIATAGGTCDKVPGCYYIADDEEQLRFAFAEVIENLLGESEVKSRTKPVTTSRTSFRNDEAGYYEISSRYKRGTSTWQGTLERVTFKCDTSGNMVVDSVVDFADVIETQPSRTLLTAVSDTSFGVTVPTLSGLCGSIPGCDASLESSLATPQLADIYHSNPTVAVAPELDLSLGGYRSFRREWGQRDTMLYVGTNDGLLHAFTLADVDASGDVEGEERWAYIPRTIHSKLALAQTQHVITVDGTPVVKDVRLSRDPSQDDPSTPGVNEGEKWATVLVGTLRSGGRGIFALDISNPDDPKFLWEHTALDVDNGSRPFARLGYTYGQPAIGSVVLDDGNGGRYETAVAIVPGGLTSGTEANEGEVLYVIDLATGAKLREFTTLTDLSGTAVPMAEISGSVEGFSTVPGTLMSRAFVGDALGRLLRLDLAGTDPAAWKLEVFVDPVGDGLLSDPAPQIERVISAPAISRNRAGNLVVHYGTGDVTSLNPQADFDNYVVSVTENIGFDQNNDIYTYADVNWLVELANGAKLTGAPLVFNNTAFFPTLENGPGISTCGGDNGRLWAAHFTDTENGALKPMTDLNGDGASDLYTDFAAGTVIFGLDVAVRPACYETEDTGGVYSMKSPKASTPQLVLQTGNPAYAEGSAPTTTTTPVGANEVIDKVRIDLPPPPTSLRTTSWGALYK